MGNPNINMEFVNKYLCRGSTGPFFNSPRNYKINNRILAALCYAFDTKHVELAAYSGCSIRSIQRYIYQDQMPRKLTAKKMCFYFNISEQDLFGPHATIKPLTIKALQTGPNEKYSEINNTVAIGNRLLFGLMYAAQLKAQAVADSIGINLKTMQRILYTDKDPSDQIKNDLSNLFCIPVRILFNNKYRSRKKQ